MEDESIGGVSLGWEQKSVGGQELPFGQAAAKGRFEPNVTDAASHSNGRNAWQTGTSLSQRYAYS